MGKIAEALTVVSLVMLIQPVMGDKRIDEVAESFHEKHDQLEQIFVEFQIRPTGLDDSKVLPVFVRQAARKGEFRFFDLRTEHHSVSSPNATQSGIAHTGMSYNGVETRILTYADHGRIFPGDEQRQFRPADEFLGYQGFPTNGFTDLIVEPKEIHVGCDIASLLNSGSYNFVDETPTGLLVVSCPTDRMTFDKSRNFALVKRELFLDDGPAVEPIRTYKFSEFFEFKPRVWLAKRIEVEANGQMGTITAQDIRSTDIPDSLFTLNFPARSAIENFALGETNPNGSLSLVVYRIPTNPENLDEVIAQAVKRSETSAISASTGSSYRRIILVANVILIFVVIAYVASRRFGQWSRRQL